MTSRRTANRRGRPKWPVPREGRATGGLIAALTLGVAALGGCGGDSADGAASAKPAAKRPAQVLRLTVDQSVGRIVYDKNRLRARPGRGAIELTNPSPVPHNIRVVP